MFFQPDITAPGVSILAAFTNATSPTFFGFDTRRVPFNVLSGTSMSCPHISGVVALLKSANPTWSPAMIKSAIMTTGIYHMQHIYIYLIFNFLTFTHMHAF